MKELYLFRCLDGVSIRKRSQRQNEYTSSRWLRMAKQSYIYKVSTNGNYSLIQFLLEDKYNSSTKDLTSSNWHLHKSIIHFLQEILGLLLTTLMQ
jgi:hypothetical protein